MGEDAVHRLSQDAGYTEKRGQDAQDGYAGGNDCQRSAPGKTDVNDTSLFLWRSYRSALNNDSSRMPGVNQQNFSGGCPRVCYNGCEPVP